MASAYRGDHGENTGLGAVVSHYLGENDPAPATGVKGELRYVAAPLYDESLAPYERLYKSVEHAAVEAAHGISHAAHKAGVLVGIGAHGECLAGGALRTAHGLVVRVSNLHAPPLNGWWPICARPGVCNPVGL